MFGKGQEQGSLMLRNQYPARGVVTNLEEIPGKYQCSFVASQMALF